VPERTPTVMVGHIISGATETPPAVISEKLPATILVAILLLFWF